MKTTASHRLNKAAVFAGLAAAALLLTSPAAHAVNYAGNGGTDFGGDIGTGVMSLTDDGTNINGLLTVGNANSMYNTLVIYIDTGAGGGFADTSTFNDQNDGSRRGISGVSGSGRSLMTFTNGFRPQYAMALGPNSESFGGLWQLASGGNNSLNYITTANLSPTGTPHGPFTFSIPGTAIGLTNGHQATIKLFGTYISDSAYRSTEAIAGNLYLPFGRGWNPDTNTAYGTYTFAQAVVPTYAVKFSVDMTAAAQLGNFVPGTDTVYCGGSFQTPTPFAFSSFQLVQSNGTDIYTNSYLDADPTNTLETYKFSFTSVAGGTNSYDSDPNRTFTLRSNGQVVPLEYFNNVPASPSATTNYITFQIDMGPQIYEGHFNPGAGDIVSVSGSFEQPNWTGNFAPIGYLTNNPTLSGDASNIYSGTFADGNYPGAETQYKYIIIPVGGAVTNYENGANRPLVTPVGAGTLPLAYFNGISTYGSVPITFSVDMTVPLAAGEFNPAGGDTVGCAGTFQTNSIPSDFAVGPNGFTLTNNPTLSGTASNVYSGTYLDLNAPNTVEQYKFVINPGGSASGTIYEEPASTGGANRQFVLGGVAATNPLVFWSDESPNAVALVATTVTFHVNMTNAVDIHGTPFNPDLDLMMVDGDFTTPQWQVMSDFADATIQQDFPQYIMTRDTQTGLTYSLSFVIPAGNPLLVNYKYGILRNSGPPYANTNIDNEAGFAQNHTRYIRTTGTYDFPLDIFGLQRTNAAAATEQPIMNLTLGSPVAGQFPISWLGLPNTHLQYTTNLVNGVWVDLNATTGGSSTNWPKTTMPAYFRVVLPLVLP